VPEVGAIVGATVFTGTCVVAVPVVCALPPAYPVLDVVTVTVAEAPEPKPLTVNGYVLPEIVPKETEPELVDMPHVYDAL